MPVNYPDGHIGALTVYKVEKPDPEGDWVDGMELLSWMNGAAMNIE